ncbi:MAG: calcium/sodium antiporter [Verrucomicrobiota bacterium]
MPILIDIAWLLGGLIALYFGAEWLVGGASKISLKFGISPLAVGLTVVAFGTSAPELFVSVNFNGSGQGDMSVGNVVGSNICNIGLVLGVSAFICLLHVKKALLFRDTPLLLISTLGFIALIWDGKITTIEGAILFAIVLAYTIYRLVSSRNGGDSDEAAEFADEIGEAGGSVLVMAGMILAGLVLLYVGSIGLEKGGVSLAKTLGVPGALISLTVIAFSTSVPELATSVVASLKKEGDIIIGNVIGSCLFNLLCVIGITALIKPIEVTELSKINLYVMLGFTAILLPIMALGRRVDRWSGLVLLLGYLGYCAYLWTTTPAS